MASAPHAAVSRMPDLAGTPLGEIAEQLERTRWAAEVCDSHWRLVYVSRGLRDVVGFDGDDESLGIGSHVAESRRHHGWDNTLSLEDKKRWALTNLPYVAYDTPGGIDAIREMMDPEYHPILDEIEPRPAPRLWASYIDFVHGDLPPTRVNYIGTRSYDRDGKCAGTLYLYGPSLPTTTLSLVARGDEKMLNRMAALIEPGRRKTAVLFADLQSSGSLSKRLPTSAYFKLIQAITTAVDQKVADMRGIVGKHAGDGVTAFFLADEFGSSEEAARMAIEAARAINSAATETAENVMADVGVLDAPRCAMNIGVHWGGTLYLGQIVTGGRLEVTAIGDEVNECARIQETARDGKILVSKPLIEHLTDEDARRLRIDPNSVGYRTLSELPDVSDKAVRDAGSIPVTILE